MQKDSFSVAQFPSLGAFQHAGSGRGLRVCIATEEILGPVRNGGIASTYYHLARGLAARGYEVHVQFLKGRRVENQTPEHWVEHFKAYGITLHFLDFDENDFVCAAPSWQARYYRFYEWLLAQPPFQVVHTSEWRGGAFYALMAKRLVNAFADTLFIIKTSSPHIWNRHYQMQPIQDRGLVAACYAEQKVVEYGDITVGGSAHLITFMDQIGYQIEANKTYVQPNIVDFGEVKTVDGRSDVAFDETISARELTFFGRLETRKGLELFCQAVDALLAEGVAIDQVNFLGKEGARLAEGGEKPLDYIRAFADKWSIPVEILPDKNQPEAISFLCSRDMIAVMPSLIENSTMAVYEALVNKVPFLATAVGGTPELIELAYHARTLVEPTTASLAAGLRRVLSDGQVVARPSYSNADNLETWFNFHGYLAERNAAGGLADAFAALGAPSRAAGAEPSVALIVTLDEGANIPALAHALEGSGAEEIVLCADTVAARATYESHAEAFAPLGARLRTVFEIGQPVGALVNAAVDACASDAVILALDDKIVLSPDFVSQAKTALALNPDILFTSAFKTPSDRILLPFGGDMASQFFDPNTFGPEVVASTKALFRKVGGLEPYSVRAGLVHDFVARGVHGFGLEYMVMPRTLGRRLDSESPSLAKHPNYAYFAMKPLLDRAPLDLRKLLLYAGGGTRQSAGAAMSRLDRLQDGSGGIWLIRGNGEVFDERIEVNRAVVFGVDASGDALRILTQKADTVEVFVNGAPRPAEPVDDWVDRDNWRNIVVKLPMPSNWVDGARNVIKVCAKRGDTETVRFATVTRLTEGVHVAFSVKRMLEADEFDRVVERRKMRTAPGSDARSEALAGQIDRSFRELRAENRAVTWLLESAAEPFDLDEEMKRIVVIGVDANDERINLLCASGDDTYAVVDGMRTEALTVIAQTSAGSDSFGMFSLPLTGLLRTGDRAQIQLMIERGEKRLSRWFQVTKLAEGVFAVTGKRRILNADEFGKVMTVKTRIAGISDNLSPDMRRALARETLHEIEGVGWVLPPADAAFDVAAERRKPVVVGLTRNGPALRVVSLENACDAVTIDGKRQKLKVLERWRTLSGARYALLETPPIAAFDDDKTHAVQFVMKTPGAVGPLFSVTRVQDRVYRIGGSQRVATADQHEQVVRKLKPFVSLF